jgi:acetoin utilization protein AcuB
MLMPPISRFMTRNPRVIQPEVTLAEAHRVMRRDHIRHLPVLRDLRLVGIVSDRELFEHEAASGFDPDRVTVEEVMTRDVLTVAPQAELAEVAELMRARGCGSVVVVEHDRVVGIFTTSNALEALSEVMCREA